MAFPHDVLDVDEHVVVDLRPHWRRVVAPLLLVPVLVGLTSYVEFVLPAGGYREVTRIVVGLLAALAVVRWSVLPWLGWHATRYVLTTHRVMVRRGWLTRSGRDVALTRISDVAFSHSLTERMFRSGTLVVESAGESGQVVLTDVPRVSRCQRELYRLVEDARQRSR